MTKVALITGANGVTGSAILEYLVQNTTAEQWSKIIITSRSQLTWSVKDPRVSFIALDFSQEPSKLQGQMRDVCKDVTHAYFSSYVHKDDFAELNTANRQLFENFLSALVNTASGLENVTLQTGGKYYNVHLHPVPSPAREEDPRHTASIDNFYFPQEDFLAKMQKGQKWSYNIIRPEAIVGSTSKPNGMNSALTFALYFIICKELGVEAPMPTNQRYWEGTDDMSYAPLIADLSIFVSTNPKCANEAFNVTNGDHFTWRYLWPRLAAYFGAKASSDQAFKKDVPTEGQVQLDSSFADWSQGRKEVWERLCERKNLPGAKATFDAGTWAYQDWVFQRTWSATLSINKARRYGWTGHIDTYTSLVNTFEKFRAMGLIPE